MGREIEDIGSEEAGVEEGRGKEKEGTRKGIENQMERMHIEWGRKIKKEGWI